MNTCLKAGLGLRYPGFSIVLIQMFSLGRLKEFDENKAISSGIVEKVVKKSIDHLIFVMNDKDRDNIRRYRLHGFDFSLVLDRPYHEEMKGHVSVEMLVLFGYMVSLTYRFVFDGDICSLSVPASTDHIIAMLSAHLSAEHWSRNEGEEETNINLEIKDFKISGLSIDADGNVRSPDEVGELYLVGCSRVFDELSVRYKRFIKDRCSSYSKGISREERLFDSKAEHSGNNSYMDLHYAMVDIWENVSHPDSSGCDLFSLDRPQPLDEEQIVQHIKDFHKEELIGLMSLYPEEWPYRDKEAYGEVCGCNIAIDTDDLVLVNSNVCVVIGTYGRRGAGSPVDWAEHLEERKDYHVSWPEYLFILEMVLAKKYVIGYASDQLVDSTLNTGHMSSSELIAYNAELSIRLSRMVLQLNVVKYSKFMSHKVMFDRTTKRLDIENDQKRLIKLMEMVDSSLHNISDYKAVKSDYVLNFILAIISVVSTFEILFQDVSLPFIEYIGLTSSKTAAIMVWFVAAMAFFGILLVLVNAFRRLVEKGKRLFEK
ncbi:MAG: hypothetical protein IAB82_06215 [Bacteroidetes bacterium]|uniref:Uncharacterized protein n=1 Tax=Candidatus Cryptobacteroides faecavium TaxID=2840762 RepID=A0A9D9IER5_9BACT|nr:hypothetical protein [Candidatus Cryptobacteroides faecavium]